MCAIVVPFEMREPHVWHSAMRHAVLALKRLVVLVSNCHERHNVVDVLDQTNERLGNHGLVPKACVLFLERDCDRFND